jgi:hypothetical protein
MREKYRVADFTLRVDVPRVSITCFQSGLYRELILAL